MDHSAGTFVFDPQGRLRLYVGHGQGADVLRARHPRAAARRRGSRSPTDDVAPHAGARPTRMRITLQQAFERAFAHERAGRKAEARAIYAEILAAIPDHPGALLKLAEHDIDGGIARAARARLDAALASATAQRCPPRRSGSR